MRVQGAGCGVRSAVRRAECGVRGAVRRAECGVRGTALVLCLVAGAASLWAQGSAARPQRIVSLVPALTEMLFAIGAGPRVVGVSSFDEFPPDVAKLPRVGALIDPDTERILSLRPELVIVYGSQDEQQAQFERAGIRTFSYRHGGVPVVLETISALGKVTGQAEQAAAVVSSLRARLDAIRKRVAGRPRPSVMLVFERQPKTLREIYASGGVGFLNEILEIAGGRNVFADTRSESVQPSTETIIARAPDIIIEIRARERLDARGLDAERAAWTTLRSLPAVRSKRVHVLSGQYMVVPGPRLADAADTFARTIHPEAYR
jgi:iron complex transport system substrate-binding protein